METRIKVLEQELQTLKERKSKALEEKEYENAACIRDLERKCREEIAELKKQINTL
jgi:protein-arginine kinase activator protein McsA